MVKILYCDIFEAQIDMLVHGCNCFNKFGAGLALSIKKQFLEAYEADCNTTLGGADKLGKFSLTEIKRGQRIKWVVNLYSQYRYGTDRRYTSYDAMSDGLTLLCNTVNKWDIGYHPTIGLPYGIGCGLGGGNFNIVREIIEDSFKNYKGDVYICKKP